MILLAVSVFAGAGTIHYQTPMLGAFAVEFNVDAAAAGWVATLTFGGFLAGTIFLVPLGDRFDKRRLILAELSVLIVALLAMAAAPSLATLAVASLVVGITAGFAQLIIPLTAELAPPETRGRVMGALLACLFLGILFGRVAGGLIAHFLGWRWTYVGAAVMLLALAPALVLWLPSMPTKTRLGYGLLLRSLFEFLRDNATLRRASTIQFLLGISYGGFWATVAPMMLALHGFGPAQTGLLAIPGAAGILVSQPAGRWTDRRGAFPIVTGGEPDADHFGRAGSAQPLQHRLRRAYLGRQRRGGVSREHRARILRVARGVRHRGKRIVHRAAGAVVLAPGLALAHCGWMFACFAIFRKTAI